MSFDYDLDFARIDFRERPELYRIGRGEQGVLTVQPYKGEILPHWRFRTPAEAERSAAAIEEMFDTYLAAGDFPGADMARKFLQMGYTRARRYANHRSGRKWNVEHTEVLPRDDDPVKAESARIFKAAWDRARTDPEYLRQRAEHESRHEHVPLPAWTRHSPG